jgi:Pyruvate/2-oxoacid:ferredoxin oxidoreductase delta subunit
MSKENRILLCHCSDGGVVSEPVRREILAGLRQRGLPFVEVDDLCWLAADRDPVLATWVAEPGTLTVIACHARAVRGLFVSAGLPSGEPHLQVLDMRAGSASGILERVPDSAVPVPAATPTADSWKPWYPVIDLVRCVHCRQCMSFCLFGVYSQTPDGKVAVTNPRGCKNNCPACARICPQVAIIFPKLPDAEAPLNGAEIGDEQNLKARARVNAQELLGDDLYAALAQRRETRRRLLKTAQERAEEERAACWKDA